MFLYFKFLIGISMFVLLILSDILSTWNLNLTYQIQRYFLPQEGVILQFLQILNF